MKPAKSQLRVIDNEVEHPLDYARRKVREWRSDAAQGNLPLSNQHDDKGAAVLDTDVVLERSLPDYGRRK